MNQSMKKARNTYGGTRQAKSGVLGLLDQQPAQASLAKRVWAYLVDWFCSSLCLMFPLALLYMYITKDADSMRSINLYALEHVAGLPAALAAMVVGLILMFWYLVIVPWKVTPGQTMGKRMAGLKIVKTDGQEAGWTEYVKRQFLGMMILEGSLYSGFGMVMDAVGLSCGLNLTGYSLYAAMALTLVSLLAAILGKSHRMIHDYLAGTTQISVEDDAKDQRI